MIRKSLIFFIGLFCFVNSAIADTGFALTFPVITKDPQDLHGYRAAVWYQPPTFIWGKLRVFFDASFGHWWINGNRPSRQVNIIAFAPTLRYYFKQTNLVSPYIDLSLGLSYLSKTRFGCQNLGMHFAFQDQIGLGVTVGKEQKLSISLSTMHYSNGSMASMNAGITIPLLINVGYRF